MPLSEDDLWRLVNTFDRRVRLDLELGIQAGLFFQPAALVSSPREHRKNT